MTDADLRQHARDAHAQVSRLLVALEEPRLTDAARAYIVALVSGAVESLRQAADLAERRREQQ